MNETLVVLRLNVPVNNFSTDLKVTCKAIKGFDYLIQWQIVEFVRTTVACSATFNHSIMEKYFRYAIYDEAVKITFFYILEHVLHLLDTNSKNSDCKIFNCIEYLPV